MFAQIMFYPFYVRSIIGLSFFQKLVLCRGLKFALPQKVSSPIDVIGDLSKSILEYREGT